MGLKAEFLNLQCTERQRRKVLNVELLNTELEAYVLIHEDNGNARPGHVVYCRSPLFLSAA
jgi:hypothetical protein